jgi:uncharacterized protein
MIRDDKERIIGKLVNINSEKFTVELLNQSINFSINGFDDVYQYAQINGYVILPYLDFHIVAEIFGVREKDSDFKWNNQKEQILSKSNSVKYLDITPIGTIQKKSFKYGVSVFPTLYSDVLYIRKEELDIVFEVKKDEENKSITINEIDGTMLYLLDIGTSTIFPDYKVKIDINGFFGHHSAVLGNTGSGKSCTISSMIQTICKKESFSAVGSTFLFFDVNGEYHKAFSQINNKNIEVKYYCLKEAKNKECFVEVYEHDNTKVKINDNITYEELKLPHWFLNIDEWALLLQASQKTQLPILRTALGLTLIQDDQTFNHIVATAVLYTLSLQENSAAKGQRIYSLLDQYGRGELKANLLQKHKFNSQYGSFNGANVTEVNKNQENFVNEIKEFILQDFQVPSYFHGKSPFDFATLEKFIDLAILYEEAYGNKQIRDFCSSLLTRLKNLREREEFAFLTNKRGNTGKADFLNGILGLKDGRTKKTQITIIDLNTVEDEVVEVISCVISRMIFEKLKTLEPRNRFPVNTILEEAHRYISNDKGMGFGDAVKIFERIAKEGRKYGMFLLVSSQRPSELSKTVLSQCSNFIIHRIQNPEDLLQIRQMTPHISATILSRLPSIPRQHALVFGHCVQIPTLFKVNDSHPTPHSHDNDVIKNWFIPKEKEEETNIVVASESDIDLPF